MNHGMRFEDEAHSEPETELKEPGNTSQARTHSKTVNEEEEWSRSTSKVNDSERKSCLERHLICDHCSTATTRISRQNSID